MHRRNDYDVTNNVMTTDPEPVKKEVCRIYEDLYQESSQLLIRPFDDFARLYRGENPDYCGCETTYHDMQHVLDVALAMARVLDGYERHTNDRDLDARLFRFGVTLALFHDCGYIRHRKDTHHASGAEYTLRHVSRGAKFLKHYMAQTGMNDLASPAARVVHFTGYEVPVGRINVPAPVFRLIGNMLGTSDIIAQMADRCYLEKCYDRLYPEFVLGGIACQAGANGSQQVLFSSPSDLIAKTPRFYANALRRLQEDLAGVHLYVRYHFGGEDPYLDAVEKNAIYAARLAKKQDMSKLRRRPPPSAGPAQPQSDLKPS
jgi:hypothetical protein